MHTLLLDISDSGSLYDSMIVSILFNLNNASSSLLSFLLIYSRIRNNVVKI